MSCSKFVNEQPPPPQNMPHSQTCTDFKVLAWQKITTFQSSLSQIPKQIQKMIIRESLQVIESQLYKDTTNKILNHFCFPMWPGSRCKKSKQMSSKKPITWCAYGRDKNADCVNKSQRENQRNVSSVEHNIHVHVHVYVIVCLKSPPASTLLVAHSQKTNFIFMH